jgi:asparaginyl-tRNA synthetase
LEIIIKNIFESPEKYLDNKIKISGWVKTLRVSKRISFIEINDGSDFKSVQVVFDESLENYELANKINVGSSICVIGFLKESVNKKKNQEFEIKASEIKILGDAGESYPLQKKKHSLEFLRSIAHLRSRTNFFRAVFKIRSIASFGIHKFFREQDFIYIHTPIITASDCEGAGELFKIEKLLDNNKKFFGKDAYLTVSGQLSAETLAMALRRVYTVGPTFRAENSNTSRHAAEFWMIEPEMAFCDLDECMRIAEAMLKFVIKYVLENARDEIDFCNEFIDQDLLNRLNLILESRFNILDYSDAIRILEENKNKKRFEHEIKWGIDLQTEHERFLTEEIFKAPVFIINYPKDIKAFYMKLNQDNKTVAAMDLLVPGIGEIIGGSQREENLDLLLNRMKELNLNPEDY